MGTEQTIAAIEWLEHIFMVRHGAAEHNRYLRLRFAGTMKSWRIALGFVSSTVRIDKCRDLSKMRTLSPQSCFYKCGVILWRRLLNSSYLAASEKRLRSGYGRNNMGR